MPSKFSSDQGAKVQEYFVYFKLLQRRARRKFAGRRRRRINQRFLRKEVGKLEIVNNPALLSRFLRENRIEERFSSCKPKFILLHYRAGDLLSTPFQTNPYLQFVVKGDLLLYDMPNEESTVSLPTSYTEIGVLGEMELVDQDFTTFFVEATSEVYTVALYVEHYREELLNDTAFLRYLCRNLSHKLRNATETTTRLALKDRIALYISRMEPEDAITGISHLARQLNVSERQLLRVLKSYCGEGILRHEKAGVYRVVRKP